MPPTYRIRDWDSHYENNRTREIKQLGWVPIPCKLAGSGYTEMVCRPNGAAVYGAWVACVLVAASCGTRGTLVRGNGEPHDFASLSRVTRLSERVIREMIEVALALGWIEVMEGAAIPQEGAAIPHLPAQNRTEQKEQNGTEANGQAASGVDRASVSSNGRKALQTLWLRGFPSFWKPFPRKVQKRRAEQAWLQLCPETREAMKPLYERVMDRLEERLPEWETREEQHRPHAATFLRGESFEEDA